MDGNTTTLVGNLVADPEIRTTPSGVTVANFRVAQTPRVFDKQANEWKDGDSLFMSCSVWREQAESLAKWGAKGVQVIVVGHLKQRDFEVEGQKRSVIEMEVEHIGPAARFADITVTRRSGAGARPAAAAAPAQRQAAPAAPAPAVDDTSGF